MLPVKSLFVTQTIPYKKVAQVATGAQQHVLHDTQERPLQLSRCERFVDKVFCRGTKQTTLSRIREMSRCTALLHLELEKPEGVRSPMMIRAYSGRICDIQVALKKLMAGDTLEFGWVPGRALVDNDSFLVHRSETVVKTGIPLTRPAPINVGIQSERAPGIGPGIGPGAGVMPTPIISRYSGDRSEIDSDAFSKIKRDGRVNCAGKVFRVRFLIHDEPAVLGLEPDHISLSVQKVLSVCWLRDQGSSALVRLDAIRSNDNLSLPVTFPDTESELFAIRSQLELDKECDTAADAERRGFTTIVLRLENDNNAESSALREIFQKLSCIVDSVPENRKIFLCAETRLSRLENRHRHSNERLTTLKQIYWRFFELAKVCTSKRMQDIPLERIKKISAKLTNLNDSVAPTVCAETLAVQLQNASLFIQNFSSSLGRFKKLLTSRPEIVLSDGVAVLLPVSPELDELIGQLCKVASGPDKSWQDIQSAMQAVQDFQDPLAERFTRKLNAGVALNEKFETLVGEEGLNLETGESFYNPRTYSRIVSLRQIRVELLNRDKHWTDEALRKKIAECDRHVSEIQRDTGSILAHARTEGFTRHIMYLPEMNPDGLTPISFFEWSDEGKGRERELKENKERGPVE